jgi:hypothetical protein
MLPKTLLAFALALTFQSHAYFDPSPSDNHASVMNDINFSDRKDFMKTWHLVTVRYREDTRELRFVYANDLAWKAMRSLKPDYPDGASFGKVGVKTESDPVFASSQIPGTVERYQLMVKNKAKYKTTDGWGYALFDGDGFVFNEDLKQSTQACMACHRIVPQRDFVFSRLAVLSPNEAVGLPLANSPNDKIFFKEIKASELPRTLREEVEKTTAIESLEGEIKKNAFSGTLDEIIPLLLEHTRKTRRGSVMILDERNFSAVVPLLHSSKVCANKQSAWHVIANYNSEKVRDAELCN